ncbi:DUF2478 domain-containing protein [Paracoccus spongiarum]|uniref:DUF2478 domain-containing protein n=1 Tax=Paracoccus spongiarum TaxID=3064387 RepID=A0ABT9JA60_9RHOB|nr:DUF2478 domain-containing protein [Paracoccus sp. 2205BS29-5]MDP5306698.1 DUF2478 domain-containing protein [Paracoccus sp. 2205BS29-5]
METAMLGWFGLPDSAAPGEADRLLARLVDDLTAAGLRLAGAVQHNLGGDGDCACEMDVVVIGEEDRPVRISQSLGRGSTGCRLDAGALEVAALRVARRLAGADLLIVPKFGRQEAAGRGFRDVIAQAIGGGLPVLLHVPPEQRADFLGFCDGIGERLAPDALADWAALRARRAA